MNKSKKKSRRHAIIRTTINGTLLLLIGMVLIALSMPLHGMSPLVFWIFAGFAFTGIIVTAIGSWLKNKNEKRFASVAGPLLYLLLLTACILIFQYNIKFQQQRNWSARAIVPLKNMYFSLNNYRETTGSFPISIGLLINSDIEDLYNVLIHRNSKTNKEIMIGNYSYQQWLDNDIDLTTIDTSTHWEIAGDFLITRQPALEAFNNLDCVLGISPASPTDSDSRVILFGDGYTNLIQNYKTWREQYNRNLPKYAIPIPDWLGH